VLTTSSKPAPNPKRVVLSFVSLLPLPVFSVVEPIPKYNGFTFPSIQPFRLCKGDKQE
jgi:hypothetical protein